MTTRARVGDLVRVDWTDAWSNHEESEPRDWDDDCPVSTVGFLIRERPVISVGGEKMPDGKWRCVTHIPLKMVGKVEVLRRGDR